MKNKRKKDEYIDDGHTIYSMDIEGFKWHDSKIKNKDSVYVTKEDKKLLIRAALKSYIPKMLIVLLGFTFAIILIYFWLN